MATKNTRNTKMPERAATAAATGLVFVFLVFFVANLPCRFSAVDSNL
jgi:hypothetical protein